VKYGIANNNTYNFDETGFQMGVVSAGVVVTTSERREWPKAVQPGNREWATVIAAINALGWAIPPFIIVAGMYHVSVRGRRYTTRMACISKRQRMDNKQAWN
jgi:hypothetical protein